MFAATRVAALLATAVTLTGPALAQDHATVFSLRSFGAAGDGTTDDTAALQRAVDATAAAQGTLHVAPGTYRIATVQLRSHMTLLLDHGAVLLGSPRAADYAAITQFGLGHRYGIDSSGEGDRVGMLIAQNAEDIRITGEGVIDGNAAAFFTADTPHVGEDFDAASTRNPAAFLADVHRTDDGPLAVLSTGRPGTLVQFHHVRNVTIDGVTLRNAPNWTLHLQHATGITVHALHIANDVRLPNNDGMDCMDCHDVRVSDASITAGDDDFALVGSSDIAITNSILRSNSASIRFEDSQNAVFSNLVIHSNRGIGIFAHDGTHTRNVLFSNIVLDTRLKHGHWWGKGEPIYLASSLTAAAPTAVPTTACGKESPCPMTGFGARGGASAATQDAATTAGSAAPDIAAPAFAAANDLEHAPTGGIVENIRFANIEADTESGILLDANNPGTVRNLTFTNVALHMHPPPPQLAEGEGGNFDLRWTAKTLAAGIVRHDIPAFYAHNIATLAIDGLQVTWSNASRAGEAAAMSSNTSAATGWPTYFTNAVDVEAFQRIELDRVDAAARPGSTLPVIVLQAGNTASVRDSESTDPAQPLLHTQDLQTPVFTSGNRAGQRSGLRSAARSAQHRHTGAE